MPRKAATNRKPQQGRHKTKKTKCVFCGTYYQNLYMFINGKMCAVGEGCPECLDVSLEIEKMECERCKTQLRIMSNEKEFYRYCPACGLRYEIEKENNGDDKRAR